MRKNIFILLILSCLSGCFTSGSAGKISANKGLEAACGGGCASYKSDGTGCAVFNDKVSNSCADYFVKLCSAVPDQCKN